MFGLTQSLNNHAGSAGLWVLPHSKQAAKQQSIRKVPEHSSDMPSATTWRTWGESHLRQTSLYFGYQSAATCGYIEYSSHCKHVPSPYLCSLLIWFFARCYVLAQNTTSWAPKSWGCLWISYSTESNAARL